MIYTELTNKAMQIAYRAHHGQFDCNGIPYIFHPIHLAEQMKDEITCCVALLHDTIEDTSLTMEELKAEFPKTVTDAVALMTHAKDTDYFDYVHAINKNPIAKTVKLADLAHNSDLTRCVGAEIPQERLDKWKSKYDKAKQILAEE